MRERNYLYRESTRYEYKTEELRNRQSSLAQVDVKLEELVSPNQSRMLITLKVYMPIYEVADPIFERETLLDEFTPDHKAIRKAIANLDDACKVAEELIASLDQSEEQWIAAPDRPEGITDWPGVLAGRLRHVFSFVDEAERRARILKEETEHGQD